MARLSLRKTIELQENVINDSERNRIFIEIKLEQFFELLEKRYNCNKESLWQEWSEFVLPY